MAASTADLTENQHPHFAAFDVDTFNTLCVFQTEANP